MKTIEEAPMKSYYICAMIMTSCASAWCAGARDDGAHDFKNLISPFLDTHSHQAKEAASKPLADDVVVAMDARLIAVADVVDRIVHTSICRQLAPFERRYIYDSYACLPGKGRHRAYRAAFRIALNRSRAGPHASTTPACPAAPVLASVSADSPPIP